MSTDREPSVLRQLVEAFPGLAWAHDADGTVLCANPAWRAAAGLPPRGGSMSQAWLRLMPPYDLVRQLEPSPPRCASGSRTPSSTGWRRAPSAI